MTDKLDSVVIVPLDVDNYATWSVRMRLLLTHKGVWAAVKEGTGSQNDQKALALIGLHVKDHHLMTIAECKSAQEAWNTLEAVYKAKSNARKLHLRRELNSLKKEASEPLTKYVARAKALQSDLLASGHEVKSCEVAWSVLAGLPKEYETVVTILEASDSELDLDSLLPKLLHVETRLARESDSGDDKAAAFMAHGNRGSQSTPPEGSRHHDKECYYCGKKGHIKAHCFKKKRDDAARSGSSSAQLAVALMAIQGAETSSWVLDSGASQHMTRDLSQLQNVRTVDPIKITMANGQQVEATQIGDVLFTTKLRDSVQQVLLKDVLHVPGALANLLSVSKAVQNGARVQFNKDSCTVTKHGKVVLESRLGQDGLFHIPIIQQSRFRASTEAVAGQPAARAAESVEYGGTSAPAAGSAAYSSCTAARAAGSVAYSDTAVRAAGSVVTASVQRLREPQRASLLFAGTLTPQTTGVQHTALHETTARRHAEQVYEETNVKRVLGAWADKLAGGRPAAGARKKHWTSEAG